MVDSTTLFRIALIMQRCQTRVCKRDWKNVLVPRRSIDHASVCAQSVRLSDTSRAVRESTAAAQPGGSGLLLSSIIEALKTAGILLQTYLLSLFTF